MPTGFQKVKAFDTAMSGVAREEGVIATRYTPPGFSSTPVSSNIAIPVRPQAQTQQQQFVLPYSPANIQLSSFGLSQPVSANPVSANGITDLISDFINAPDQYNATTAPNPHPVALVKNITDVQVISAQPGSEGKPVASSDKPGTADTFNSQSAADNQRLERTLLENILQSVVNFLKSTLGFYTGQRL